MIQYYPKPYETFVGNINVKVDLSNYATKTDLKNASHVHVSSFALKSKLACLKTEVDKIDADKLKTVPIDLAKLSHVVKNNVVKRTEYNKLATKVDKYEKDESDFEDKINRIDKYLMLLAWLKKEILILKLLKQKVKYLVLVV